jgi:hypothetical protein
MEKSSLDPISVINQNLPGQAGGGTPSGCSAKIQTGQPEVRTTTIPANLLSQKCYINNKKTYIKQYTDNLQS